MPRGVTWGEIGIIARNAAANSRPRIEVFMIEFPFPLTLPPPRPCLACSARALPCRASLHYAAKEFRNPLVLGPFRLPSSCLLRGHLLFRRRRGFRAAAGPRLQPLDTLDTRFMTCRARRPSSSRFSSCGGEMSGERCGEPNDGRPPLSPLSFRISYRTRQLACRLANSLRGQRLERACRALLLTPLLMPPLRIHERSSSSSHISSSSRTFPR
jgi:hypothetical protein